MVMEYTAENILKMAVSAETGAAEYYAAAATAHPDKSDLLGRLEASERQHAETFRAMLTSLSAEERTPESKDPLGFLDSYLKGVIAAQGAEGVKGADSLTGNETITGILQDAVEAEKAGILLYLGLKESVPMDAGRGRVDDIIHDEMGHVATLLAALKDEKNT